MTTTDSTKWMTASEAARALSADRQLQEALGTSTGLEAAQFTPNPSPFQRHKPQATVTAEQVKEVVTNGNVPTRCGHHGHREVDYAALRLEIGLSEQAPTAVRRAKDTAEDTDEPVRDVDSVKRVAAATGIPGDTITALVRSGAVVNHATVPGAALHRARVSASEVIAVANNALGVTAETRPEDLTDIPRAALLAHIERADLEAAATAGDVNDYGDVMQVDVMDGTGRNVEKTIHRTARPRVSVAEVKKYATDTGLAAY
ncbi:MAG: hypothetical protein ACTIIQ_08745 [Corynebacterium variabile]|uniref:hypothetical protein n=1 Tax=Corynebacterium variabile TaxID=1727 RepID=UPI003F95A1A4